MMSVSLRGDGRRKPVSNKKPVPKWVIKMYLRRLRKFDRIFKKIREEGTSGDV